MPRTNAIAEVLAISCRRSCFAKTIELEEGTSSWDTFRLRPRTVLTVTLVLVMGKTALLWVKSMGVSELRFKDDAALEKRSWRVKVTIRSVRIPSVHAFGSHAAVGGSGRQASTATTDGGAQRTDRTAGYVRRRMVGASGVDADVRPTMRQAGRPASATMRRQASW